MPDEHEQEQELRDLLIKRDDIILNQTNDLELVSGIDNVKQSVALDVRDVAHFAVGSSITSTTIYELTAAIERSLATDPQITPPTSVKLESINQDANILNYHVVTRDNEEFTLEMVLPTDTATDTEE